MRGPSVDMLRGVVDSAVDGIMMTDASGTVRYANASAAALFGYDTTDIVGRELHELIPDDLGLDPGECGLDLAKNFVLAFTGVTLEVKAKKRTGEPFPVELTVSRGAEHLTYAVIARDISARQAAEQAAHELQSELARAYKLESVGRLSAGIAHEINTPMQYVGDNLAFLGDAFDDLRRVTEHLAARQEDGETAAGDPGAVVLDEARRTMQEVDYEYLSEEIPSALAQAREGVDRITKIVSAMKAFCHPGSEQMAPVDLNKSIQNTVEVSRSEWKHAAVVDLELDETLPTVVCNDNEIKQVFLNITVNAAHALAASADDRDGAPGHIGIATTADAEWIQVVIRDDGPGIPDDVLPNIFDPFFTTKELGKGSGQGLAIAHGIVVDNHLGEITVHSAPGEGTSFVVRLPRTRETA